MVAAKSDRWWPVEKGACREHRHYITPEMFKQLADDLRYVRNETGLATSTTPGQLNLPDVVQKARDLGATVFTKADVVKRFGTNVRHQPSPCSWLFGLTGHFANGR